MSDTERWTIWKASGREDDAIQGPDCHGVDVAPVDELEALRRQLTGAVVRLEDALQSIVDADSVDLALDPAWAQRVARDALRGQ